MKKNIIFSLAGIILALPGFSQATTYNFYVDKASTASAEEGTEANPYKTITKAIEAALNNGEASRNIYIKNGEYQEDLELGVNVKLYGQDQDQTKIINNGGRATVEMGHGSELHELSIEKGDYGVEVEADAKATIEDCEITNTDHAAVFAEDADINDAHLLTIEDSVIKDNDKKGLEINKRKISIKDNEILDNDEEGIDLRDRVAGTISGNTIKNSGEGGIEMELKKADIKIKNNKLSSNGASGINFQFRAGYNRYKNDNEVTLTNNTISRNHHYGIRCSSPTGGGRDKDFFSKSVELKRNDYKANRIKSIDATCKF